MAKRSRKRRRHDIVPRRSLPGIPPGTVRVDPEAPRPVVHAIAYDDERIVERAIDDPEQIVELLASWPRVWINIDGLGDAEMISGLGRVLGLHPLSLEDIVNVHQRPKLEQYDEYEFVVLRMAELPERGELVTEQFCLFLGEKFVATFQERPGDCLDPVRERLRKKRGRVRKNGADYLAYALLDAVVDSYFPLLERLGDQLEQLEDLVLAGKGHDTPRRLMAARHDLLTLRRAIWPLREALASLYRDDTPYIGDSTRLYLRDCYDHTVQLLDVVEAYREVSSGLMDVHLSAISNRMNEVMKVLTVIATIFIPLTFVSSIYGMNFDPDASPWNMPELRWRFGYPFALGIMAAMTIGLLLFFRTRGWLRSDDLRPRHPEDRAERAQR
jgi:magnesium transporter